jgi:ribose/xylose/arabinose/galactoside ABC-type transport system permease subunit
MAASRATAARERPAALALAALLALLAIAAPAFFSPGNLRDVVMQNVAVQVIAIGMLLVVLTGQVDVSVGASFGVCAVALGVCAKAGVPVPLAAASAVLLGTAIGLVNGVLVGQLGLPSIVVTLAMLVVLRDGLRWATEGAWVRDLPRTFQWFGLGQSAGQIVIIGAVLAVMIVSWWGLRHLAAGRALYAAGSDPESARLAGLSPSAMTMGAFAVCGGLTGLGAVLNAVRFAEVPGASGAGLELKVIAAVIVGGAAITGGRGSTLGTVLGVALLGAIGTGLTFLGVSAYWEHAVQGAIILAAILSERAASRPVGAHA